MSKKVQGMLDDLFMPKCILRKVQEVNELIDQLPSLLFHNMRFPGTINLIGNSLPTLEYLERQRALKLRQQAIRDGKVTDESNKDKPNGKNEINAKGGQKPSKDNQTKGDDGKESGAVEFSPLQDKTIIDMKVKDAQWKAIATEIGKEVHQVKERFKQIKPDDFDKCFREQKEAMKEEKTKAKTGGGGAGGGGGGNSGQDQERDGQGEQSGGKKGKKNKGKGPAAETAKDDDRGGDNEADGWWEQADGNWSKDELEALMGISNEELRNAFVMISMRLSKELGKNVHPVSVAEKILGTKPEWM